MYPSSRQSGRATPAAPPAYDANPRSYIAPSVNYPQPGANARQHTDYPSAASDRTPLLRSSSNASSPNEKTKWVLFPVYLLLFFLFLVCLTAVSTSSDAARERVRRAWDKEIRGHEKLREAWNTEVATHEALRTGWEAERTELVALRAQLLRDREEWSRECGREKQEEARRKEDEAARVRAGFAWDGLSAEERCVGYGARRYSARLANVPREYDPMQACTETSIEIHGRKLASPSQCEDRGCSGVFGHWTGYSEPTCKTHFDKFNDKGCTSPGSGRRRIESRLENLKSGDDWRDMCSTTPADFRHLHFDGPQMCEHWGISGVWGFWEIEDGEC
ncbi:hypothetical protein FB451DRAFT_1281997 [Mycena latifolia]|nr:hypothetical protein FB451DRAFT_1281997 [Mycena latifolia]